MKLNLRRWANLAMFFLVAYLLYSIYEKNVEITQLTQERDELRTIQKIILKDNNFLHNNFFYCDSALKQEAGK